MEFVRRAATRFASRPAVATIVAEGGETNSSAWADYGSIVHTAERTTLPLPPRSSTTPPPIPISTPAGNSALVGPRVAIWGLPGPEFVASLYACYLSGAVAVPLSPQQPGPSLSHCLADSGASALLAPERLLADESSSSVVALLKGLAAKHRIPLVSVEDVATAAAAAAAGTSSGDDNANRQQQQHHEGNDESPTTTDPRAALIVYTSGSTGRPKGVVHSAASLLSQADGLSRAWRVSPHDRVLHALPLHHVHGLVNALHSPLGQGARVRFLLPRFSARAAWGALAAEADKQDESAHAVAPLSSSRRRRNLVFHGVPTMYSMLLEELGKTRRREDEAAGEAASAAAERGLAAARDHARLFVCGSAACPPSLWRRWQEETGHPLLERYGMTEAGMILSNPFAPGDLLPGRGSSVVEALAPAADDAPSPRSATADDDDASSSSATQIRRPGSVGLPLPGVDVRLVPVPNASDDSRGGSGNDSDACEPLTLAEALALEEKAAAAGDRGEAFYALRVRGPSLFSGYWKRDDATREAFASSSSCGGGGGGDGEVDGFFDTGDVVAFDRPAGGSGTGVRYLRVVGRASADVIKPRGFKVSGLDVEAALLQLQREGGSASSSPLVSECAVFGGPDARFEGEELVVALVRLEATAADGDSNNSNDAEAAAASLSRGVAALLPAYALPRVWLFLPPSLPIPRNAMGKVNKKALRAALFPGGAKAEGGARWVGSAAELAAGG